MSDTIASPTGASRGTGAAAFVTWLTSMIDLAIAVL